MLMVNPLMKKKISIVYGTLSGTSKRVATQIKSEIKKCIDKSGIEGEIKVSVIAGNAAAPDKLMRRLRNSSLSIFVTPTYDHADGCCDGHVILAGVQGVLGRNRSSKWALCRSSMSRIFSGGSGVSRPLRCTAT